MKSVLLSVVLLFVFIVHGRSQQGLSIEEVFAPKMPARIDTLYYPFYHGVQMIEVDHIAYWDRKIFFLEQSQPRAMPHSMNHPQPIGNEYFFRDTNGEITKAFNTGKSISELTKHFQNTPLKKKGNLLQRLLPYHISKAHVANSGWAYSIQPMFYFNGYYKISNSPVRPASFSTHRNIQRTELNVKYGLIDSMGNVILPLSFDQILPLNNYLLVSKNMKWGVINISQATLVPLAFDSYDQYYSDQEYNDIVYFKNKDRYSAAYYVKTNKLVMLDEYDDIYRQKDKKQPALIRVIRDGKMGFIDSNFKEIIPPQYELSEYQDAPGLFRVMRNGKFGFINKDAKEIIPCEYDYADPYAADSIALVLKEGSFFTIDKKGKRTLKIRSPNWELNSTGLPPGISRVSISVNNHSYYGLIRDADNKIIFPFDNTTISSLGSTQEYYYSYKNPFSEKKGIIDLFSLRRSDYIYDAVDGIYDSKIIAVKDGKSGVLDTAFNTMIAFKYPGLDFYLNNPDLLVFRKENKEGLMDFSEKVILPADKYDDINSYTPFAIASINRKKGVLNAQGIEIIPCLYDDIYNFGSRNYLIVRKAGKSGIVDMNNKEILPIIYDEIYNSRASEHREGYFHVKLKDKRIYVKE